MPVRPAQRLAGPVAGLRDTGQLHERSQRVSRSQVANLIGGRERGEAGCTGSRHRLSGGAGAPGMASSNCRVYSWLGRLNTSSVGACSTTRPARITRTSSAICRITARSWLMNR